MRKLVSIASAAFSLVLGAGPLHAASVEAYGRPPSIDNVSVSPDGAQIAFVQTVGDKRLSELCSQGRKTRRLGGSGWGEDAPARMGRQQKSADHYFL
jgi:hypothetical protein